MLSWGEVLRHGAIYIHWIKRNIEIEHQVLLVDEYHFVGESYLGDFGFKRSGCVSQQMCGC